VSAPFQTPERIEAWGRAVANALLAVINDDIAALVAAAEQRGREQAAALGSPSQALAYYFTVSPPSRDEQVAFEMGWHAKSAAIRALRSTP
jgi:hypothetical protein